MYLTQTTKLLHPIRMEESERIGRSRRFLLWIVLLCVVAVWLLPSSSSSSKSSTGTPLLKELPQDLEAKAPASHHSRKSNTATGVIVLGMHRSGTSMLTGLLATAFGYHASSPPSNNNPSGKLIQATQDNAKGHFELSSVVHQNDALLRNQNAAWAVNVKQFNATTALTRIKSRQNNNKELALLLSKENKAALDNFFHNPETVPWIQKDPRMCITLPVWLELLNDDTPPPAILFTYRNPLEVAQSLKSRETRLQGEHSSKRQGLSKNVKFTLEYGLQLWIDYNQRALEHSSRICRITTSNDAILNSPLQEIQRISQELTDKCGVVPPAAPPSLVQQQAVVDSFVDPTLHHNTNSHQGDNLLKSLNDGTCLVYALDDIISDYMPGSLEYQSEQETYLRAMQLFCDLQSGEAYQSGYQYDD